MTVPNRDAQKRAAAEAAIAEVLPGMLIGLGTGSTAAFAIEALANRVRAGLNVASVATSSATAQAAARSGITVLAMDDQASVDLCIDGVDEIDADFRAIKGGGGAMVREKIVASAAIRNIAIADGSKLVERIGARPVTVEILSFARQFVSSKLAGLGADVMLRATADGAFRSDQGNVILDCRFGPIDDPEGLAAALDALPGVVGHGLFLTEIDALYLGTAEAVRKTGRPAANP